MHAAGQEPSGIRDARGDKPRRAPLAIMYKKGTTDKPEYCSPIPLSYKILAKMTN